MSLLEHIRAATSVKELQELLKKGKTYFMASARTKRRWQQAADRRKEELQ